MPSRDAETTAKNVYNYYLRAADIYYTTITPESVVTFFVTKIYFINTTPFLQKPLMIVYRA